MVAALQVYLDKDIPDIPPAAEDVWEMSLDLETARSGYGYGCVRFSWPDMRDCFALFGFNPKPWKIRALREMESVWLNHKNNSATTPAEPEAPKTPKVGRAFSPELFDAWFGK